MQHARAAFDELVGHVRYGMVGGAVADGDPEEVAQQIWSAVHGAVQLEIKGILQVPDAEATYRGYCSTPFIAACRSESLSTATPSSTPSAFRPCQAGRAECDTDVAFRVKGT